jgi:hypothetical protein
LEAYRGKKITASEIGATLRRCNNVMGALGQYEIVISSAVDEVEDIFLYFSRSRDICEIFFSVSRPQQSDAGDSDWKNA